MRIHFRRVAIATLVAACVAFAGSRGGTESLRAAVQWPGTNLALASGSLRDPALPASIDIVGSTEGHGGATAGTITVRVGAAAHSSPGVIAPQYQAVVPGVRAGDMVSVQIDAPGVKFTSILGSYGRLVALAGADGVLTVDECDALRVSPFSTALEFFVRRELGDYPASDAQHEATWRKVVSGQPWGSTSSMGPGLETATVVLARLASGEAPLPPGYENGYALLEDREAASQFVDQVPEALDDSAQTLTELSSVPLAQDDLAPAIALLGPMADATAPLVGSGAQVLESIGAGFRVHSLSSRRNSTFSGGLNPDGDLDLMPDNPIYTESYVGLCNGTGQQVIRRTSLTGQHFRLQRAGRSSGIWMLVDDYEVTHSDCPDYFSYNYQQIEFKSAVELGAVLPSFEARHVFGLRALPFFCVSNHPLLLDPYLAQCEYALHRFERNGTGTALELGAKVDDSFQPVVAAGTTPFSWSLSRSGPLQVQYGNVSVRYWTTEPGNGAVRGLVFVAEAADGGDVLSMAGHAPMLDGNVPGGFDTLSPVGTWKYATFEQFSAYPAYFEPPASGQIRLVRSGDGRSQYREITESGERVRRVSTWSLVDGRLYDAYVLADGGFYYTCDEAYANGESNCGPWSTRYFRPMRRVGNRLYGIEDLYMNSYYAQPPPYQIDRASRPTYYELVVPSP